MSIITILPDHFVMRLTNVIREERRGRLYEVQAVGVFSSEMAERRVNKAILDGVPTNLRIDFDDGRSVTGPFIILNVVNGEITMVSIGATHVSV